MKTAPVTWAAVGCLWAGSCAWGQAARSVWDGVYAEAQAQRGESLYQTSCAGCHGVNLEGKPDPSLIGPAFIDRWREDNLSTIYNHIAIRMPARAPGSLGESAYLDVLAFILRSNEMPAGAQDLTAAATAAIRLIRQEGPQPLPTNAVILVVGCFVPGAKDTWTLTHSIEPMRTKIADETNPEEVKRSAALALGSQSYRLQNLDFFRSDFQPAAHQGQKVQVKGVLIRQTGLDRIGDRLGDRINVTSFEPLGSGCN